MCQLSSFCSNSISYSNEKMASFSPQQFISVLVGKSPVSVFSCIVDCSCIQLTSWLHLQISRASLTPESSYIAKPAASWLDDFLVWLSPEAFGCCRKFVNGSYCPPDDQVSVSLISLQWPFSPFQLVYHWPTAMMYPGLKWTYSSKLWRFMLCSYCLNYMFIFVAEAK